MLIFYLILSHIPLKSGVISFFGYSTVKVESKGPVRDVSKHLIVRKHIANDVNVRHVV